MPNTLGHSILYFPLTKVAIGLAGCLALGLLGFESVLWILPRAPILRTHKELVGGSLMAILVLITYVFIFHRYEKRKITELSAKKFPAFLTAGLLLGAVLQGLTFYFLYTRGGLGVLSTDKFMAVLPDLASVLVNSVTAEILLLGIVFRIMEDVLGSYLALILFTLIFIGMHASAPQSTPLGVLGVALHGGLLLGAAYIFSRSLWFPIALHVAWDFIPSGIFGAKVMGHDAGHSLLVTKITGPDWLTGGFMGPQGSAQAVLLCLVTSLLLLWLSHRQHKIVQPCWHRLPGLHQTLPSP